MQYSIGRVLYTMYMQYAYVMAQPRVSLGDDRYTLWRSEEIYIHTGRHLIYFDYFPLLVQHQPVLTPVHLLMTRPIFTAAHQRERPMAQFCGARQSIDAYIQNSFLLDVVINIYIFAARNPARVPLNGRGGDGGRSNGFLAKDYEYLMSLHYCWYTRATFQHSETCRR